ncbi:hypothetical protein [uncultured Clostridium sp.]|uniref:hypothetical protein n=1 Tax=uncultured Clostridium sp. TaxID=59620 RepID=UPI0028E26D3B|nr:hypothetical protein [uncultured Clostridium sp.]
MNYTQKYNGEEILSMLNEIFKEVVPEKVTKDITLETLITEDLALDSVEIMDILLKIRQKLTSDGSTIDMDKLLNFLVIAGEGQAISVQSLCNLVDELV